MAKPGQAHADFVAKLAAEGYLPIVQGKLPAKMPVEALPLTNEEKARIKAPAESLVVFYPVEDTGVFLQLGSSRAVAWYEGVPCDNAVATVERAFKNANATLKFVEEKAHPEARGMDVRIYRVETDAKHFVDVEMMFPADKKARQRFMVYMTAWERT